MKQSFAPPLVKAFAGALLGLSAANSAFAQSPAQSLLENTLTVQAGGFLLGTDIKARLQGGIHRGNIDVDFDRTFNLGRSANRWRADSLWRMTPAHQLRFSYFDFSKIGRRTLDRDIAWGDYTFLAGAEAEARYESSIYVLTYEYAFLRQPNYEVTLVAGVHFSDIEIGVSGRANLTDVDGNEIVAGLVSTSSNVPAPLPVLGLRGSWAATQHLYLQAGAALFALRYGDYKGRWIDARAGATWMFNRSFGIGLTYDWFRSNVDVNRTSFPGSIELRYSGPQLLLTASF